MTDFEYIKLARRDTTWQNTVASFAIEGMTITIENEIIAGKMISGDISLAQAIRHILQKAGVT
jgi:hypothetical protein